jgi:hypothetical protein
VVLFLTSDSDDELPVEITCDEKNNDEAEALIYT